jgi:hypothetical protein
MPEADLEDQIALLQEQKAESIALGAAEFSEQHRGHYLLGRMPGDVEADWSLVTDAVRPLRSQSP